jgi:PAS domain S-box-containing protein
MLLHPFNLDSKQFNKLFPFYILLDAGHRIVSVGTSLAKVNSIKIGIHFQHAFTLKRPEIESKSFDAKLIVDQIAILESKTEPKLVLRGQFECIDNDGNILFVGTPWFGSIDQLVKNNLSISDFALHDPMIDLLHVLKTQEITTEEIKQLLKKVNDQKNVLKRDQLELKRRENMLEAISQATDELLSNENFTSALNTCFSLLGKAVSIDRIHLFENKYPEVINGVVASQTIKWNSESAPTLTENPEFLCISNEVFSDIGERLSHREAIKTITSTLPTGSHFKARQEAQQIKSILIIPVFHKEDFWGFLEYCDCKTERIWSEVEMASLKSFSGSVANALARSESAKKLKESENRISSLVLNLQTGILLEDETRHIVLCNKMFCNMFSIPVPPELLYGTDCSGSAELSKGLFKEPDLFVQRIDIILLERKPVLLEQIELIDGRIFERDYVPIFISNEYKGHLWKYTDVTESKNHERNLKKQEEKYRSIIQNIRLGLLEVNLADEIQYANQNFSDISGYNLEELLSHKAHELLGAADASNLIAEKSALRKRGVSDSYELLVKNKEGQNRWWLISGAPNYNDMGELIGSIGIHLDISEQKELEVQLRIAKTKAEESSKAKESFLANMSHEIRTPLNAIIGMVRELSKMNPTSKQDVYLKHADSASQHLLSIINNILDISKIEAGEFNLDTQTFSLASVFRDTEAIMAPAAKEKLLDFKIDTIDYISPAYLGDPNRIRQILINIISNSIKFTERGSIYIKCVSHLKDNLSEEVKITISDTGIGMDQSYLQNLFKKFTQEDLSIGRKYGGTGLGMAITYELVHLMGGTISVTSEKNKGTEFKVNLILKRGSAQDLERSEKEARPDYLPSKLRILLVEDNELNRLVAINSLSYYNSLVTEAINGQEAIEVLKHNEFDVILMDLQMPIMDGLEATKIIRNELKLDVPIIALTANAFKKEIEKCIEVGMNDYVTKPFDEKLLIHVIQKFTTTKPTDYKQKALPIDSSQRKLYDLSQLIQLSHGNKEFVSKMTKIFCANIPATIKLIREAFNLQDYQVIRASAHKIKPSIDNMGIVSLKSEIRYLEVITPEKHSLQEVEVVIEKIERVIQEVVEELERSTGKS